MPQRSFAVFAAQDDTTASVDFFTASERSEGAKDAFARTSEEQPRSGDRYVAQGVSWECGQQTIEPRSGDRSIGAPGMGAEQEVNLERGKSSGDPDGGNPTPK
jgi:hypothetical protein